MLIPLSSLLRLFFLLFVVFSFLPASSAKAEPPETSPAQDMPPEVMPVSFWKEKFSYSGELRQETAFRVRGDSNLSKIRQFAKVDLKFKFYDWMSIKLGGRGWYDAVYDLTDQYPPDVNDNMRKELSLRDAYLDFAFKRGGVRIGHQQIVWGEALGQFFADVVTPKDLREFLLPSFEEIRLPVWALDINIRLAKGLNLEGVFVPDPQVNKMPLPGSEFAFFIPPPPPGVSQTITGDQRPDWSPENFGGGGRLSYLVKGWDLSGLYYTSPDHFPALFKRLGTDPVTGVPFLVLIPRHQRVHHVGGTFSKDIGPTILRGEMVYTRGRFFNARDPITNFGVIRDDLIRYVLGFDYPIASGRVQFNSEFQQQIILGSKDLILDQLVSTWLLFRFQTDFFDKKLEPEIVFIVGLNDGDTLTSPRLSYHVIPSVTLTWGADIFTGPQDALYGEFAKKSRVYMNTRFKF